MAKIRLTTYLLAAGMDAAPGQEIEVTAANAELCQQLLADKLAVPVGPAAADTAPAQPDATDGSDGDDEDGNGNDLSGLSDSDPVTALAEHGIHGRYIAALADAGLTTIGQVKAHAALSSVPGISDKAAAAITAAIA